MAYFKRARTGTVMTLGGHSVTFQADTPTYVIDDPEVIQAVISAGAAECDAPEEVTAPEEADAPTAAKPARAGRKAVSGAAEE